MLSKIIADIKAEQTRHAVESVSKPMGTEKDAAYEYGLRVGFYGGLQQALVLIERALREQDRDFEN